MKKKMIDMDNDILLQINDLHAAAGEKEILGGIDLTIRKGEIHAVMGPNGAGKSTLSAVLTGKPEYTVTSGSVTFMGSDLLAMKPEERSWAGIFMSFQYPVEIPGVTITNFMKTAINSKRKAQGLEPMKAAEFLELLRSKMAFVKMKPEFAKREVNVGFSGGEKKRNEIFQMAMLDPVLSILDETDSGLDVDALKIVADGVNSLRTPQKASIIITHYQKLLEYIEPDYVHVLKSGKIVATSGKELVGQIEAEGFDKF
jgi:Fe-S cluster assembly ATP-binding protein